MVEGEGEDCGRQGVPAAHRAASSSSCDEVTMRVVSM